MNNNSTNGFVAELKNIATDFTLPRHEATKIAAENEEDNKAGNLKLEQQQELIKLLNDTSLAETDLEHDTGNTEYSYYLDNDMKKSVEPSFLEGIGLYLSNKKISSFQKAAFLAKLILVRKGKETSGKNIFKNISEEPLMITIVSNGTNKRQVRVRNGQTAGANLKYGHVDSCGKGMIACLETDGKTAHAFANLLSNKLSMKHGEKGQYMTTERDEGYNYTSISIYAEKGYEHPIPVKGSRDSEVQTFTMEEILNKE